KIAWSVPSLISRCPGIVSLSVAPSAQVRRSLMWLPRWEWRTNPKPRKIRTSSAPDRRRSLGMRRRQLQGHENRGLDGEAQRPQVLAVQIERNRLAQVGRHFVEGVALGHDGDLLTRGHVSRLQVGR